jgi:hypothetical protein
MTGEATVNGIVVVMTDAMIEEAIMGGIVVVTIDAMIDEAVVDGIVTVTIDGEIVDGMITDPAGGFRLPSRSLRFRGQFFTISPAVPCWPGSQCSVLRATW